MIAHRWKFCGLAAVLVASWQASALADGGRMSRAPPDELGLSGLRVMSDEEALAVRGQGAFVYGFSFAAVAGSNASAGSTNGYFSHGPNYAEGENFSYAEVVKIKKGKGKQHGGKSDYSGSKSSYSGG